MNLRDQNKQKKHSAPATIHKSERTGSYAAARLVLLGLALSCLMAVGNVTVSAEAASSSVKKLYMDYLEKVPDGVDSIESYTFINLNDDGKKELVFIYKNALGDFSRVCTIKNGEVQELLDLHYRGNDLIYTIKGMKSKLVVAGFYSGWSDGYTVYNVSADSIQESTGYTRFWNNEESKYCYEKGSKKISADEYQKFENKLQQIETKVYDPKLMEGKPSNKAAYKAYYHAMMQDVIDPEEEDTGLQYALKDINNDGIKELMFKDWNRFQIWTYRSGKAVLYLEINADDTGDLWGGTSTVCYDADKKTYWVIGIRGLGMESYKKKGKTVEKRGESYFNWADEGPYAEKTIGNKTTRISMSTYSKKLKQIFKEDSLKLQSDGELYNKLRELSSE